jgi:FKBP-type peptidyl-prolyl cis-trans isomerase
VFLSFVKRTRGRLRSTLLSNTLRPTYSDYLITPITRDRGDYLILEGHKFETKGAKMGIRSMFVVGIMLLGSAVAQQPAASKSQPAAATKAQPAPAAKLPEAPAAKNPSSSFPTEKEKASYALGMNIGSTLHRQGVPGDQLDLNVLQQGLKDAMGGGKTLMTEEEERATLQQWQKDLHAQMATKNKSEGEAFLTANKGKEGVTALPSGLQYKILTAGTGPKPTAKDTVVCNYRGTFLDGTEFDSSYKRGQPSTFPVTGVIKGWTEALQLMPTGSKWQLFIPSDLAYGEQGRPSIPPNSALIFEVELVSIKPPEPPPAPAPAPTKP